MKQDDPVRRWMQPNPRAMNARDRREDLRYAQDALPRRAAPAPHGFAQALYALCAEALAATPWWRKIWLEARYCDPSKVALAATVLLCLAGFAAALGAPPLDPAIEFETPPLL